MNAAERIYELVKELPEAQAIEVLDFVETLQARSRRSSAEVVSDAESSQNKPLSDYIGLLKDSPTFQGDPVEIQRQLRNEWD